MQRKLEIREQELKRAQSRDNTVQNHLNALNDKQKAADKKVELHYDYRDFCLNIIIIEGQYCQIILIK